MDACTSTAPATWGERLMDVALAARYCAAQTVPTTAYQSHAMDVCD